MSGGVTEIVAPQRPEGAPRIAVVVPIFKHSVLCVDAIESLLEQDAPFPIRIVLVNDGCRHHETDWICRLYARQYPEQISYCPKPNGGLSDARNYGIRFALKKWPSVEAIYFMDADNRLRPPALRKTMAALDDNREAAWIYPNIDMFGLQFSGDYGGDYSRLIHSQMNICEAGSLVRRDVFDSGVFFDTNLKAGFEDWDFFLCAGDKGYRGENLEDFGFLYRKRAESMLSASERTADAIKATIEAKHPELFSPAGLISLEQKEAPRFAVFLKDRDSVLLTVDPESPEYQEIPVAEYWKRLFRAFSGNTRYFISPFLIVSQSSVWEALRRSGTLHSTLWNLERRVSSKSPIALASVIAGDGDRIKFRSVKQPDSDESWANLLISDVSVVGAAMQKLDSAAIEAILVQAANPSVPLMELGLPSIFKASLAPSEFNSKSAFISLIKAALEYPEAKVVSKKWEWRTPDIGWRNRTAQIAARPFKAKAAYPRVGNGQRNIGVILPLAEFGGVERVALNVAAAMKRRGFKLHLFVTEADNIYHGADWRAVFDSVSFLSDENFKTWGYHNGTYFGTGVGDWERWGDQANALSMLGWLDGVINFHGAAISGVMGQLKKFGIITANSLHLSDQSAFGRLYGNTYHGLSFEHAYDFFLPCSHQLADWCHAMGVPVEKIIAIPNAPSFERPAVPAVKRAPLVDPETGQRRKLRALYIGRLDPQKGLDRLEPVVEWSGFASAEIEWRIVGKQVIRHAGVELSPAIARMLEKPKHTPEEMTETLEWADVLVLTSYYEGLPLIVLEAMRSGTVPICTDVGANSEVVQPWENGVLLSNETCVEDAIHALERLAADPALLEKLSRNAAAALAFRDWDSAVAPFLAALEQKLA